MTDLLKIDAACIRYGFAIRLSKEGNICSQSKFEINPLHIAEFLGSETEQKIRKRLVPCIDQVCTDKFNFISSFMEEAWTPSYHSGASISASQPEVSGGGLYGEIESKLTITYRTSDTPSDQNMQVPPKNGNLHNCFVWLRFNLRQRNGEAFRDKAFKDITHDITNNFRQAILGCFPQENASEEDIRCFTFITVPSPKSSNIVNAIEYGYSTNEIMTFDDDTEHILLEARNGLDYLNKALRELTNCDFDTAIPIRTGMGDTAAYVSASQEEGTNTNEAELFFGIAHPPKANNKENYNEQAARKEACMRSSAYLAEHLSI